MALKWKVLVLEAAVTIAVMSMLTMGTDAQTGNVRCSSPEANPRDSLKKTESMLGVLYFYPTPFNASCIGTVVTYDYCYRYNRSTEGPPQEVVTVVVLEAVGNSYTVVWTRVEKEDDNCSLDTTLGFDLCCISTSLTTDEMFMVTNNSAYGFITPGFTQNSLLVAEDSATGYVFVTPSILSDTTNLPPVGSTLTQEDLGISGSNATSLQERSFQFSVKLLPPDNGSIIPTTTTPLSNTDLEGSMNNLTTTPSIPSNTDLEESANKVVIIVGATVGAIFAVFMVLIHVVIAIILLNTRRKKGGHEMTQRREIYADESLQVNEHHQPETNTDIIPMVENQAYAAHSNTAINTSALPDILNPTHGYCLGEGSYMYSTDHVCETHGYCLDDGSFMFSTDPVYETPPQ